MVLTDRTILKRLPELIYIPKSDESVLVDKLFDQINPNSMDLTISDKYMRPLSRLDSVDYGFKNKEDRQSYVEKYWSDEISCKNGYIVLNPGDCILGCTSEYIRMPKDLCGQLFTKSTLGRMFINHMMAGVIDSGFEGRLTLELKNDGVHTVRIPVGARIVQLYFFKLDGIPEKVYGERKSRYMNSETVECAKWAS